MNTDARHREGRLNPADPPENLLSETKWGAHRTRRTVVGLLTFAAISAFPATSAHATASHPHGPDGMFPRVCLSNPPKLC